MGIQISDLKKMSKEEFLTLPNSSEELYNALRNSKEGWIKISRVGDGEGESGYTYAFGEGISCKVSNIDRWYMTSVIQSIDWKNHTFKTLNSTYSFEFKDKDQIEEERKKSFERIEKMLNEYGSKN